MKSIHRTICFQIIFPLFVAGFLSIYKISEKSLWLDEVLTVRIASLGWTAMWNTLTTTEPYRWLYYVLLHVWTRFGSGDTYYRLLSVLFALTAIPGMYLLGKELRSPAVGASGALLLAIHPMFHRYAQEVHSYSLLLSLVIWSSYFFVLFAHKPSVVRIALYVLGASFMVYAHSYGIFVIASHYISLVYAGRFSAAAGRYTASFIALGFAILPLLLYPVPYQNTAWIQAPNMAGIIQFFLLISGGNPILCIGFISLFVYQLFLGREAPDSPPHKEKRIIAIWFLFPVIAIVGISYVFRPIFVPRYLIIVLPALLLLISSSMAKLPKIYQISVLLGCALVMLMSTLYWHTEWRVLERLGFVVSSEKEDWRSVANYIREHDAGSDSIIFFPYFIRYPFEYYWNRFGQGAGAQIYELSSASYTIGGIMPEPNSKIFTDFSKQGGRIWLVLSHNNNSFLQRNRQSSDIMRNLESLYSYKEQMYFTGVRVVLYY